MKLTEGGLAGSWIAVQADVEELTLKWYKAQLEFSTYLNQRPFDSGEWELRGDSLFLYGSAGAGRYQASMPDDDTLVLRSGQKVQRFLRKEEWQELWIYGPHTATSTLKGEDWFGGGDTPYSVRHLGDNSPGTCWCEGVEGSGIGEKIYLTMEGQPKSLIIANGYGKSQALFDKNNRVKAFKATILAAFNLRGDISEVATKYICKKCGPSLKIDVRDVPAQQTLAMPFDWASINQKQIILIQSFEKEFAEELERRAQGDEARYSKALILCLEITDVYKGTKFNDTCISELAVH